MIYLIVVAMVRSDKEFEFDQAIDSVKTKEENKTGKGSVITCRNIDAPSLYCLVFEWETDRQFGCYLDSDDFHVLRGAITLLCGASQFFSNSSSEKWFRIKAIHHESPLAHNSCSRMKTRAEDMTAKIFRGV